MPAADRNGLLSDGRRRWCSRAEYEGFGAPLIEAMALGCPVICSDSTCIPAIVDGAGLVLPLTIDAWADALDRGRVAIAPTMIAAGLRARRRSQRAPPGERWPRVYAAALERS